MGGDAKRNGARVVSYHGMLSSAHGNIVHDRIASYPVATCDSLGEADMGALMPEICFNLLRPRLARCTVAQGARGDDVVSAPSDRHRPASVCLCPILPSRPPSVGKKVASRLCPQTVPRHWVLSWHLNRVRLG